MPEILIKSVRAVQAEDRDPDLSWLETEVDDEGRILKSCRYSQKDVETYGKEQVLAWIEEDRRRLRKYGSNWWMVGVYAEAQIMVRDSIQTIRTPGLWGIESDSAKEYLVKTAIGELDILRGILADLRVQLSRFGELGADAVLAYVRS